MSSIGCGRFNEAQWIDYMFGNEQTGPLHHHHLNCRVCRSELSELQKRTLLLRQLEATDHPVREAFVSSVLAEHAAQRAGVEARVKRPVPLLRPLPLFGSGLAVTVALLLALSVWMPRNNSQFDLDRVSAPIRTASISMLVESEDHPGNGVLVANGVTYAVPSTERSTVAPTAAALRAPSGSTHTVAAASF